MVIERVGVLSLGSLFAVLYGGFGLLIGGAYSLVLGIMALGGAVAGGEEAVEAVGVLGIFGCFAFVLVPLFYALIGFLCGLLAAVLFNLSAMVTGGLRLRVRPEPRG